MIDKDSSYFTKWAAKGLYFSSIDNFPVGGFFWKEEDSNNFTVHWSGETKIKSLNELIEFKANFNRW